MHEILGVAAHWFSILVFHGAQPYDYRVLDIFIKTCAWPTKPLHVDFFLGKLYSIFFAAIDFIFSFSSRPIPYFVGIAERRLSQENVK
jgi:hypothetical protein